MVMEKPSKAAGGFRITISHHHFSSLLLKQMQEDEFRIH
jgi:hypothetical protein